MNREWDSNKLTVVRNALRKRGDIRRLVSRFESLAENHEDHDATTSSGDPPVKVISGSNEHVNFPPSQLNVMELRKDHSPTCRSTARSSSSRAIDKMFDFVEMAEMLTPRSSVAHRSSSIPHLPLATSTPMSKNPLAQEVQDCEHPQLRSDEQSCPDKNKVLLREIAIQQEQIAQAVEAIALCHRKNDFNGTTQELNAQRILLVANERRLSLIQQLDQLNELHLQKSTKKPKEGLDTIDITSVSIYLNRNYYLKASDEDVSFVFVMVVKCGAQVYATQSLEVVDMETLRAKTIQVRESIRFDHLSSDFVVTLEVFALKKMRRQAPHKHFSLAPSKLASRAMAFMGGGKKAIASGAPTFPASDFFRCGVVQLNNESVGKKQFLLSDTAYPLEGTVDLRITHVTSKGSSPDEHL